jgi:hypothetical protein
VSEDSKSPEAGALSQAWARLGEGDRWVYGLVALLALAALGGRPILAFNDTRLPVAEAWRSPTNKDEPHDPWGRPFERLNSQWRGNPVPWVARSAGPNGEFDDEDDVLVRARPPDTPGIYDLYHGLATWPWFLAAVLAGAWELWRFLSRPRHPLLRVELGYAAAISLPLGLGLAWLVHFGLRRGGPALRQARDQVAEALFVSFDLALAGSACGAVLLVIVGVRAQQPERGED